jgi:peptidase YpeB-like protein
VKALSIGENMRTWLAVIIAIGIGASSALAGRAVTEQERTKLEEAVNAQGCSGEKMEFDDGKFEVEDAICSDGKKYDLDFDQWREMPLVALHDVCRYHRRDH